MRRIRNPFSDPGGNDCGCFGCSPANRFGLRLEFWDNGEELLVHWTPERRFEGFRDVLHGGIQATLMDEAASWYVFAKCGTAGVTSGMDIQYKRPLLITDGEIVISASLKEQAKRIATISCKITGKNGVVYSTAEVRYFLFPEEIARGKYHYPGIEAFSDG
jgi:acyl-coenzyme A thioesterase PaaI-like protein